jgi:hypothetical protein
MRTSLAYFAGAGTVLAAIVGGVGGGLLIANIVSPQAPKQEMTLLERRMSHEPIKAAASPTESVPSLPQPSAASATVAATPAPPPPPAQTQNANAPMPALQADVSQTRQEESPAKQAQPAAAAAQPVMREQAAAPDDAVAKSRGGEARRVEDTRKSRTERRQQWTERRRYKPRQEQELIAVEEKVREETEPRRQLAAEPARIEMPQIRLFGPE